MDAAAQSHRHRHRAVACFYGLLDVLRAPLARFVTEAAPQGAVTRAGTGAGARGSGCGGVHAQLCALLDHLQGQFPAEVRRDMELMVRVETRLFYEGEVNDMAIAIAAVSRLLEVFAGDDEDDWEAKTEAQEMCRLLCKSGGTTGDEDEEDDDVEEEEHSDSGADWAIDASWAIPVGDYEGDEEDAKIGSKNGEGVLQLEATHSMQRRNNEADDGHDDENDDGEEDEEDEEEKAITLQPNGDHSPNYTKPFTLPSETSPQLASDVSVDGDGPGEASSDKGEETSSVVPNMSEVVHTDANCEDESAHQPSATTIVSQHGLVSTSAIGDSTGSSPGPTLESPESELKVRQSDLDVLTQALIARLTQSNTWSNELRAAIKQISGRDFGTAIASINQELARTKSTLEKHATLYALRARCRFELKQYPSMLRDAESGLSLDPTNAEGYYWASLALTGLGRCSEANATRDKGLSIDHKQLYLFQAETRYASKTIKQETTVYKGVTPSDCAQEASKSYASGQFTQAVEWCSRGLTLYASDGANEDATSLFVQRGECYFALGDYFSALKDANRAVQRRKYKYAKASSLSVRTRIALSRHVEALQACVLAIAATPDQPDLVRLQQSLLDKVVTTNTDAGVSTKRKDLLKEGVTHSAAGNFTDAIATFTNLLLLAGSHKQAAPIYMHRARCYMEMQWYALAAQDASIALAITGINVMASKTLCDALLALGNIDATSIICVKALGDSPDHALLMKIKSHVEEQAEDSVPNVAIHREPQPTSWEQELKEFVSDGLASVARSNHKAADKIFDKALLLLEGVGDTTTNAAAVAAKRVSVLGHKARSAVALEDYDSAIDHARRGLSLDPEWVEGRRLMCKALMALGRCSEALHACDRVLNRVPHDTAFQTLRLDIVSKLPPVVSTKPAGAAPNTSSSTVDAPTKSPPSWQVQVQALLQNGLAYQSQTKQKKADAEFSAALVMLSKVQVGKGNMEVVKLRGKLFSHRARCRLAMNQHQAAATDAREAIASHPDLADGHKILCRALISMKAWRQAVHACNQVLAHVPRDPEFVKLKEQLFKKPEIQKINAPVAQLQAKSNATTASSTFQSLCEQAMKLIMTRKYNSAESCCSDAINLLIAKKATNATAHLKAGVYINRARCHVHFGAFDRVLLDARAGLTYNPQWVEGHRLECIASMHLGKWQTAKSACDRVLAQLPKEVAFLKHREEINVKLATPMGGPSEAKPSTRGPAPTAVNKTALSPSEPKSSQEHADDTPLDQRRLGLLASGDHLASVAVKQYLAMRRLLPRAHEQINSGAIEVAFGLLRQAFDLRRRFQLSRTLLDDLLLIAPQDAIAWGGSTLHAFLLAMRANLDSVASERAFWTRQLDRYPDDPDIHAELADALFRSGEVDLSCTHMEKAVGLEGALNSTGAAKASRVRAQNRRMSRLNWSYLRARCLPLEAESGTNWFVALFTKPQQPRESRADAYLAFIQRASLEDEWFPHACYSLGMLFLAENEYERAKQFHYLADVAECRGRQHGMFPPIDSAVFADKKMLCDAFSGGLMVLSMSEQNAATAKIEPTNKVWRCALCSSMMLNVEYFVRHKLAHCPVGLLWSVPS